MNEIVSAAITALENKAVMPRAAYRYALEKMDADKKRILMQ